MICAPTSWMPRVKSGISAGNPGDSMSTFMASSVETMIPASRARSIAEGVDEIEDRKAGAAGG